MQTIKAGNRTIGEGFPTFIMAELGHGHHGDPKNARLIIEQAAAAGFDGINFKLMNLSEYMVADYHLNGMNRYQYLKKNQLDVDSVQELADLAKNLGLIVSAMCHDLSSVDDARQMDIDILSIHSTSLLEEELLMKMASLMKPVFIKASGATLSEIERAILILRKYKIEDYAIIHGLQSWPNPLQNTNLRFIPSLQRLFGVPVGYADHSDGNSLEACLLPMMAMTAGANILERHVTLESSVKKNYDPSLPVEGFSLFIEKVRQMESALGTPHVTGFSEEELDYREVNKKKTVAGRPIKKGETITYRDLKFKRCDSGISPDLVNIVIGRTALCNIALDEGVTPEMFMDL
jgi:sialic acid synthase SpsE